MFILNNCLVLFHFLLAALVQTVALCLFHAFTCASKTSLPFESLLEWFKMLDNDTFKSLDHVYLRLHVLPYNPGMG